MEKGRPEEPREPCLRGPWREPHVSVQGESSRGLKGVLGVLFSSLMNSVRQFGKAPPTRILPSSGPLVHTEQQQSSRAKGTPLVIKQSWLHFPSLSVSLGPPDTDLWFLSLPFPSLSFFFSKTWSLCVAFPRRTSNSWSSCLSPQSSGVQECTTAPG